MKTIVANPTATIATPSVITISTVAKSKSDLSKAALLKEHHVSYIGNVAQSAKLMASYRHEVHTFGVYLSPYLRFVVNGKPVNTCPAGKHCSPFCLNESGRAKISINHAQSQGLDASESDILTARLKKTLWFYEDRESFMKVLIQEMESKMDKAHAEGKEFSVRLNCTSDISPEEFVYKGENILQIFPDVQFYDYTKVNTRMGLVLKYPNYDLTFSFDGYNWMACRNFINMGGRAAVVFAGGLPKEFDGFPVVSGNEYDMRYKDPKGCVIGLHYHPVARVKGIPDTPFVVKPTDVRCKF